MEYLKNNNKILKNKIVNDFNYTCFDLLNDNIPIEPFYNYLNSVIDYKLKNIWNTIVIHWIQIKQRMISKNKKDYMSSIYYGQEYNHIHSMITDIELNNLLIQFIHKDKFKAMFVILCIQNNFNI